MMPRRIVKHRRQSQGATCKREGCTRPLKLHITRSPLEGYELLIVERCELHVIRVQPVLEFEP